MVNHTNNVCSGNCVLRTLCSKYQWQRGVGVVSHQADWHFHLCRLCLYNKLFERNTFRYSVQSKQHSAHAISDNLLWVPVHSSVAAFLQLLSVTLSFFFFFSFKKKIFHSQPHDSFDVMIVFFLQRLDARRSPAHNDSWCVLHYDEVAALGFVKCGADGFVSSILKRHTKDWKRCQAEVITI